MTFVFACVSLFSSIMGAIFSIEIFRFIACFLLLLVAVGLFRQLARAAKK